MRTRTTVGWGLIAAVAFATAVTASPVAAADASLRIEPVATTVATGGSFSVKVVQEAAVATSGAQVSIVFDATVVQIESVSRGPAYASAPIFLPKDLAADITSANATGRLAQVALAQMPPDAVPAGIATFLVVRFRAVGCGNTDITLPHGGPFNAQLISGQADLYGYDVPVTTASGHVTVTTCGGQGAVTGDASDLGAPGATPSDIPMGLIGAAAVIAIGLLGGLAWRSRRRDRRGEVAG